MFVTYVFPCKTYTSFLLKQNVTSPERLHFRYSKECEGKYPRLSQEPLLDLALHCLFELHSLPSYPFIRLLALSSFLFSGASEEPWLLQYFLQTTSNSNGTHLQVFTTSSASLPLKASLKPPWTLLGTVETFTWMDRQTDGRTDRWRDGWMDG